MNWFKSNRGFIVFLACFGVFRLAIADWNPIPSGSMRPNVLEGDVVLVNRLAYDLKLPLTDVILKPMGEPQRGDIVTFTSPLDGTRLIKRLVAVPGDVIEMRNEVLLLNGQTAQYAHPYTVQEPLSEDVFTEALVVREHVVGHERSVQVLPELSARRNFAPVLVPEDHYFFLGDNRDNSADSRFVGWVPRHLLIGRAHHILVSVDLQAYGKPRWERWISPLQ